MREPGDLPRAIATPFPEEEIMDPRPPSSAVAVYPKPLSAAVARSLPYVGSLMLGMGLMALVGFAHYPAVHDAFHDVRHTAGFPCH